MKRRPEPETKIRYAIMHKDTETGYWVVVFGDKAKDTRREAEEYLRAVLNNNNADTLQSVIGIRDLSALTVGPVRCYLNGYIVGIDENFERPGPNEPDIHSEQSKP